MNCPKCQDGTAHRSHRQGLKDYVWGQFSLIPYRCKNCRRRFYAYRAGEKSDKMRSPEERRIMKIRRAIKWKRSKREVSIFLFGASVFALVVYWITRHTVPAS